MKREERERNKDLAAISSNICHYQHGNNPILQNNEMHYIFESCFVCDGILLKNKCSSHLSMDMQMTMLLERKRPKILKNEQILQRKSPAHQDTVAAQMISRGIIRKVT